MPRLTVTVIGRVIPVWLLLLVGYLLSRVLTTALLAGAYWLSTSQGWAIAHFDGAPGFLGYLQSWDGQPYAQIAEHGYPHVLPLDDSGNVAKNPWAFLPLYPMIVRAVMVVTGLGFSVAGVLVAGVFGFAATVALHRLLLGRFGEKTAIWGALFFCFGPMSYILQVTYAESVYLFLMFGALAAMLSRRYWLMIPFGILASFAHPGAIALAAALGLQRVILFVQREPSRVRDRLSAWITIGLIGIAGIAWPFVVSAVIGNPNAYFETETAWWRDYIGDIHFFPFTPWFIFAGHYLGGVGVVIVIAAIAGFVFWITRPSVRVIGSDLTAYTVSYFAYLVAVFLPQQSLFRMLLPLSPLLGHPALSRSPRSRRVTLAVSIALQPVGILLFWVIYPP
jgi:hypothetical protein